MNIAYLKIIFASKMSPQGAKYRLLPFFSLAMRVLPGPRCAG